MCGVFNYKLYIGAQRALAIFCLLGNISRNNGFIEDFH